MATISTLRSSLRAFLALASTLFLSTPVYAALEVDRENRIDRIEGEEAPYTQATRDLCAEITQFLPEDISLSVLEYSEQDVLTRHTNLERRAQLAKAFQAENPQALKELMAILPRENLKLRHKVARRHDAFQKQAERDQKRARKSLFQGPESEDDAQEKTPRRLLNMFNAIAQQEEQENLHPNN